MKKSKTLDRTSELAKQVQLLNDWLKGRESTYCEQIWVEALGNDACTYDLTAAHRMSTLLSTYCNWKKGGNRARQADGRQHWMYYPSAFDRVEPQMLDIDNFDQKAVRGYLKRCYHTVSAAMVLQKLFGIGPKVLSQAHTETVRRIEQAFTQSGWKPTGVDKKFGHKRFRVYARPPVTESFGDVLG